MPSDYQKKKLAKKKEAAKQKGGKKPTTNDVEENGVSNGTNGEIADKLGSVNGSKENSSEKTTYEGNLLFLLVEIWEPCLFSFKGNINFSSSHWILYFRRAMCKVRE